MTSYADVCNAKTKTQMQREFSSLLKECAKKFGGTPKNHAKQQLSNVGYFAGYYDEKTREKVLKWLGATHPIFGDMSISAANAFSMGTKRLDNSVKAAW